MYQRHLAISTVLLGLGITGCGSGRLPSPPLPIPGPVETINPRPPRDRRLTASPGTYRYRLTQTAEIRAQGISDTMPPSTVTMEALFYVDISQESDSTVHATVSVDSIRITPQGSIPQSPVLPVTRIDSILQITFPPAPVTSGNPIPDSLCAYGSLTGVARLILLPELTLDSELPTRRTYSDTSREVSCRAGTRVEVLTTRRLKNLGINPTEFTIEQATELQGMGVLRRDSVLVTGSTTTRGTATFMEGSRLPSTVLTSSEGTITVQLGSVRTVFRQLARQEIRRLAP